MTRGDQYSGTLKVGQRVYSILHGGRHGLISSITGEQKPETIRRLGGFISMGGSALIDVVFESGTISRAVPESIIRGVQWRISEEVASQSEIEAALDAAEAVRQEREKARQLENERLAALRQELPAQYPFLTPFKASPHTCSYALGAKNLRTELKSAFPGIKFSVTSKTHSGGNSIRISWTDGPTAEEVQKVSQKYAEGRWDGMEDIYRHNRDNVFPSVFGGARVVFTSREISKELLVRAAGEMGISLEATAFDSYGSLCLADGDLTRMITNKAAAISGSAPGSGEKERVSVKGTGKSDRGTEALQRMGLLKVQH